MIYLTNQAKVFAIVKFGKGYYYSILDEINSFLTVLSTEFYILRFNKMQFGLNVAEDICRHKLHTVFNNLDI